MKCPGCNASNSYILIPTETGWSRWCLLCPNISPVTDADLEAS